MDGESLHIDILLIKWINGAAAPSYPKRESKADSGGMIEANTDITAITMFNEAPECS